jgi:pimeloyl-ACP methyl ester carboxylesterase
MAANVAYGSFPDLGTRSCEVRFAPENGHRPPLTPCPFRAKSGLMHRSKKSYSITSSNAAERGNGTVRRSALAVLRLIISTFVDCWTGRSAGFSPRQRADQLMLSRLKYFLMVTGRPSLHQWRAREVRHNLGHGSLRVGAVCLLRSTAKYAVVQLETMMNRRTLIGAAAAMAAFPVLNRVASAQTSLKTKNVVFVHGLFADGSCWSKVIARLEQKGINCTSVQNPLTSLHEASEAARRAIAAQSGPTVLVGHSFSGMIVSEVGLDPKITALVYVAARAPDAGEDYAALAKNYPTPPATAGIVFNDDWGQLSEQAFLHDFAGDLPPEEARVLYAVQQPFKKSLTTEKTTNAAWRTKPSFYAVSTQDRTINPDLERFMAKRMGAKTIEINASHLGLISQPDAITNLITEALAA